MFPGPRAIHMEIVRGHNALPRRLNHPVVAIGNFDGVHRGHAHIFHEARRLARSANERAEAVVLTFHPHPAKVLAPALAPPLITTLDRKLELIAKEGIDLTVVEPFDRSFAARGPVEFVDQVLVGIGVGQVVVGHDFTFGKARAGTVELLRELGDARGFGVTVVPSFTVDGIVCSSTKVREFTLEGHVEGAALLLGRAPEIDGEVIRGDGRGRQIGVPTANLRITSDLLPKNGVYAGWAIIPDDPSFERHLAAINIGTNPTFTASQQLSVEAHLLDFSGDLYGRKLRLGLTRRLREERRFSSVEALVAQIHQDLDEARAATAPAG